MTNHSAETIAHVVELSIAGYSAAAIAEQG
jgi:hypothetical protein